VKVRGYESYMRESLGAELDSMELGIESHCQVDSMVPRYRISAYWWNFMEPRYKILGGSIGFYGR
jgi:hypothetical protein